MIENIDLAPLESITTWVFRQTHHQMFGGADRYFLPFVSPVKEHFFTKRDMRNLEPEHNAGLTVVPQIMTRRAEDFLWAAEELHALGYQEVNLNLGCPSGTVTAKGKGSGFLARPEELDRFFQEVFESVKVPVSVKTRLGIREVEEFPLLMELFNRYPITTLTIHPRVQKEFYKGTVHLEAFEQALASSRNPVCYNGDLVTVGDCTAFAQRFPRVESVMIGRGAVADPALLRKFHGGPAVTRVELKTFTQTLYAAYQEDYAQAAPAAQRMKEVWFYLIHLFENGEKYARDMRRSSSYREYETLETGIFRDLKLRQDAAGPLT